MKLTRNETIRLVARTLIAEKTLEGGKPVVNSKEIAENINEAGTLQGGITPRAVGNIMKNLYDSGDKLFERANGSWRLK